MRVFHQNESCHACPNPPSSYEGGREQVGSSHFDEKPLILIGRYGNLRRYRDLFIDFDSGSFCAIQRDDLLSPPFLQMPKSK